MPALISLAAGLWYLTIAASRMAGGSGASVIALLFAVAGSMLVIAGVRMMAGHVSARRTARRGGWLALAVAMVPVGMWVFHIAGAGDFDRVRLAVEHGAIGYAAAGVVPAVVILLVTRSRRT